MPTKEQIEFFECNHELIGKLVEEENKQRQSEGRPILTNDEFDQAVAGMILHTDKGKLLQDFLFPGRAKKPAPKQPKVKAVPTVKASIPIPPDPIPEPQDPQQMTFSVSKGENGFTYRDFNAPEKFYIFKTEKELVKILRKSIFGKDEKNVGAN